MPRGAVALLLISPLGVFADTGAMTLIHPAETHPTFFWRRSPASLSMMDVAQSSLRLMGTEPLNQAAAKHLPSPDAVSSPDAVFMIAVDSSIAANMPKLQKLAKSGVQANIVHSNQGFDSVMGQLSVAMNTLDTNWHAYCASGVESILPCELVSPSLTLEADGVRADKSGETWTLRGDKTFEIMPEEVSLMDNLAVVNNMGGKNSNSLYVAVLSGHVSDDQLRQFGSLADGVLSKKISELSNAHSGALVVQLVELEGRRFLSDVPVPTPSPTSPTSTALSVQEISTYQICLWTGIGLVLVLLSAICCMVNMDIRPDSLLYAKFQADVSSKSE